MSKLELGKYPVNCFRSYDQGEDEAAEDKFFKRLHSCDGRPALLVGVGRQF